MAGITGRNPYIGGNPGYGQTMPGYPGTYWPQYPQQMMQPVPQVSVTTLALSLELQGTQMRARAGMSSSTPRGQAETQVPQPVQEPMSTQARPPTMCMASKGQARTQSP